MASLNALAIGIASALRPLAFTTQSEAGLRNEIEQLGWTLPEAPVPAALTALAEDLQALYPLLVEVTDALKEDDFGDAPTDADDARDLDALAAELAINLALVMERLHALKTELAGQLPASYLAATGIADAFSERLIDSMFCQALERDRVLLMELLRFVGIIESTKEPASPDQFQPAFTRYRIHWDRISSLFDPASLAAQLYGWGTSQIDDAKLFAQLIPLSFALSMQGEVRFAAAGFLETVTSGSPPSGLVRQFLLPVYRDDDASLDLALTAVPKATPLELQALSLSILPSVTGNVSLPFGTDLLLNVESSAQIGTGAALIIRPDRAPEIVLDADGAGQPFGEGRVVATLVWAPPEDPGSGQQGVETSRGTGLSVGSISVGIGAEVSGGEVSAFADIGVQNGKLSVKPPQDDSFLASILPQNVEASFSFTLRWSQSGLQFRGAAGLSITVPVGINLGAVRIEGITLAIEPAHDGLTAKASLAVASTVGPFSLTLEGIGLACSLRSSSGNLGNADLDLSFQPPRAIGLAIDAGVKGGGFLLYDPARGEFAGALELTLAKISLKALMMLSTKVDGAPFALLAMVYARFPGGLELGLRFTLNAVGGMIGINRGFDYQALVEALSSGAMDDILFPEDPVTDAPRIIASLASVCPVKPGAYTLALMAEVGWGSDYICALRMGLVLPLDDMRRIYLIGQVRIQCFRHMPETVRLQLICDCAGVIGFDPFSLRLDGRLRDSRFGPIGIEGQLVLLLDTGDNPRFLVAAGGFHPNFKSIPAGLPSKIDRLAVTYEVGALKAWMKGYFAVAAGTVQFGAEIGCRYKAGSIAFTGNLGMDALIHISPFTFEAETRFNVAVEYRGHELFGVHVKATLWGPDHWRIKGHGSFSILFWDVGIDFDESWGDDIAAAAEAVVLLTKAAEDLQNDTYWEFETPGVAGMVHLISGPSAGAAVHPLSSLAYRQRRFPFGLELDRIGSAPVSGPRSVPVPAFHAPDGSAIPGDAALEPFAVGEYVDLDDEARLTRPSFEPLPAGVSAGIDGYLLPNGGAVEAPLDYEQIFLPRRTKFTGLDDIHVEQIRDMLGHEAAGRSLVRAPGKFARPRDKITAGQPKWVAADPLILAPLADPAAPAWTDHAPTALSARRKEVVVTLEAYEVAA